MKLLSELTHVNRCEPTSDYPGKWIVSYPSTDPSAPKLEKSFSSFEPALAYACFRLMQYEDDKVEYDSRLFTISWVASDNDPRIGEVYFTGCYTHGRFNIWGEYVRT